MSAHDGTIAVVCTGPPNAPHDREIIREYSRHHDGWRILPPPGMARMALAGGPVDYDVDWEKHGDRIELRCRRCRFHEKRRLDRTYGTTLPPFSEVFDKLAAAEVWEISARRLVALVWPPQETRHAD